MAKNGGKRPGAGRPKGSTNRPTIFDYWSKKEIAEYFDFLKDSYKDSDRVTVFVGEQLMGKAVQAVAGKVSLEFGLSDEDRQRLDALLEE